MDRQMPKDKENDSGRFPMTNVMANPIALAMRPALGELPAIPTGQIQRPSKTKTSPIEVPTPQKTPVISPPATPEQKGGKATDLRSYTSSYELHEKLGFGAWSDVYRATEITKPSYATPNLPPSPPISPTDESGTSKPRVLAVKKPCRRDAHRILEKEARILTFIHSHEESETYIVPFYGFDMARYSIIMSAVPLSLDAYVKSAKKNPISTKTMFDPIIGAEQWGDLAGKVVSGLAFLHSTGCVHGDVKPANILLRGEGDGILEPLYCDFSSSHVITATTSKNDIEEVSAVTADYLSPELLSSLYRKGDRAVATFASDVFALAVTLLFAAIGESPYACARNEFLKVDMVKMGTPLDFARNGNGASRVMKGKAVARTLEGALAKSTEMRLCVEDWKEEVQRMVNVWREGGWARGG